MGFEADLFTVLKAAAPDVGTRVFPDFAPTSTTRPYITYQQIGGDVINPIPNDNPSHRNALIQVNVWANTRLQAMALSRAIEVAMRGATAFIARPIGAPACDYDADFPVYSAAQDFSCWHTS
jgi:hypothetical protein